MAQGQLWTTLLTAIDPLNSNAMSAVLQSTISLLEAELAQARAALEQLPSPPSISIPASVVAAQDRITAAAMVAYKEHLSGHASEIPYTFGDWTCTSSFHTKLLRSQPAILRIMTNSVVLDRLAAYLPVSALFSLASTSTEMRSIVMDTPYVFRHLDLSECRGTQLPTPAPVDYTRGTGVREFIEAGVDYRFYSGPLRSIFEDLDRRLILQDVRTLILDGLSVPAEIIDAIVFSDHLNVTILSIRGCHNLDERKLMQTLHQASQPLRPKGTPKVRGIYHFTPSEASCDQNPSRGRSGTAGSQSFKEQAGELHPWYRPSGRVLKPSACAGWAPTLEACQGTISFDAVLCRGHRHDASRYADNPTAGSLHNSYLPPAVATVALGPKGCEGCGVSREGPAVWNRSPDWHFPLLAPLPLHSSTILAAKNPGTQNNGKPPAFMMQCEDCLRDRWCHRCGKWWCADCLPFPERTAHRRSLHQTAFKARNSDEARDRDIEVIDPNEP